MRPKPKLKYKIGETRANVVMVDLSIYRVNAGDLISYILCGKLWDLYKSFPPNVGAVEKKVLTQNSMTLLMHPP